MLFEVLFISFAESFWQGRKRTWIHRRSGLPAWDKLREIPGRSAVGSRIAFLGIRAPETSVIFLARRQRLWYGIQSFRACIFSLAGTGNRGWLSVLNPGGV